MRQSLTRTSLWLAAQSRGGYKRPLDLTVLALVGAVLVPLCLLIALAIRVEGTGPVLYVQRRVGRRGKVFRMFKFRTMIVDAERLTGPILASHSDRRTTRIGAWIRRYHLDELPQVINVLRGDMSLVGPRPERPALMARIVRRLPEFEERLNVRPGIAGLAQSRANYRAPPHIKLRYDRLYAASMGPWLDVKLLAICVWKAMFRRPVWQRRVPRSPKAALSPAHRPARSNGASPDTVTARIRPPHQ